MKKVEGILMLFQAFHITKAGLLKLSESGEGLTAEFLALRGKHKGLRNYMEVFEAISLLHPLDVFIEMVFAS